MIVLSFDPGETTGYTKVNVEHPIALMMGSFPMWRDVKLLMVLTPHPDIIIVEQFKLYPGAAKHKVWSSFPTVEVIGVIKYLAEQQGVPVVEQSAADAKFILLKRTKKKKGDRHAYSALRHALLYLRRQGADHEFRDLYNFKPRPSKTMRSL